MCCSLSCQPLDLEIADAILKVGLFVKTSEFHYRRDLLEEGTYVTATCQDDMLKLSLNPGVSNMVGHRNKRHAAGVYFEIAAKYAEKVDGVITQHAEIGECAKVIAFKIHRWFANKKVVGEAAAVLISKQPIALPVSAGQPEPTAIGPTRIDLGPEALFGGTAPRYRRARVAAYVTFGMRVITINEHREASSFLVSRSGLLAQRRSSILPEEAMS